MSPPRCGIQESANKPLLEWGGGRVTAHRGCQLSTHCLLSCCLFVWPGGEAAIGTEEGGGAVSSCSPPHYLRLHLAVKWRNVFKASSDFTGALTASSRPDVAPCIVYVCAYECVCVRG